MENTCANAAIRIVLLFPMLAAPLGAAPFEPDDPMFPPDAAGHHQGQWNLRQAGFLEAWRAGATGRGVIFGIVDSKFGPPHPDLEPARRHSLDGNFIIETPRRPLPEEIGRPHGLMVAGVAAARGGNEIGICGAAPLADLVWIHSGGPVKLEDMIRHDPDPAQRIRVRNHSIGVTMPFDLANRQAEIRRAFRETAETGILHVVAAGNAGGWEGGDCGKSIYCSSPHVMVIEVEISLEIRHPDRGQLLAWLQSPSGTRRELFSGHFQDQKTDLSWIFVTHSFWGEDPKGEWKLTVTDGLKGETGHCTAFGWRMRMGQLMDP